MADCSNDFTTDQDKILLLLSSSRKLERDEGADILAKILSTPDASSFRKAEKFVLDMLSASHSNWEARQGALIGAKTIIEAHRTVLKERNEDFDCSIMQCAQMFLEDEEYAVRIAAGLYSV